MNLFENDHQPRRSLESCVCEGKPGVFLTNRHVSWSLSTLLFMIFFIFMVGYFMGKKRSMDQLNYKIDQESLTDNIYSSMYALYDGKVKPESADTIDPDEEVAENDSTEDSALEQTIDVLSHEKISSEVTAPISISDGHEYYAQLVGFNSERTAQQFVQKLAQRDITAHIKQRSSKTAKGRMIYWYQVVTETFSNKGDLMTLVEAIKRRDKLHDVRIITA